MEKKMGFRQWLKKLLTGQPHRVIGSLDRPYLFRWYLLPDFKWFRIYLHKFLRDDDDRAMHDHPRASLSICLWGGYDEETPDGIKRYRVGSIKYRSAEYRHRIIVSRLGRPAWTLFMMGPKERTWGFWCPKGFVPWYQFGDPEDDSKAGPGCG